MINKVVKRTIDPTWKLSESPAVSEYIRNGIGRLPALFGISDIDNGRIVDYIVYQLYRSRDAIEKGTWKHYWLFSQGAFEKYKNQFLRDGGKTGVNYYIDLWLKDGGLTRSQLTSGISTARSPLLGMVYLPSEERIKLRFHNGDCGMALCHSSTTGWSPFSEACNTCKSKSECEQWTARNYPELTRFRKEVYGKQKK